MSRIALIAPDDPPDAFPSIEKALDEPDGLLAAGGDLSPERLLCAYRQGIFPWFEDDQPILWWSPDPRMILVPEEFHVSRSLRRTLKAGKFDVSADQACPEVIRACASTREDTWITPAMYRAYLRLHGLGHVHSLETWAAGELVGGLYGVHIGGVFFGESMFSVRADASKVAAAALCQFGAELGISLIDCQLSNPHLETLGARLIPRRRFLSAISELTIQPTRNHWKMPARAATCLL